MEQKDSRRVPGPNILWRRPCAVLDIVVEDARAGVAIETWSKHARAMLVAVGWEGEDLAVRRFHGGITLGVSAPIDALLTATEVNEWAWAATVAELSDRPLPVLAEGAERLRATIAREQAHKRGLAALWQACAARDVACLFDDDQVTLGQGSGSVTFRFGSLPSPAAVDWRSVHDVPLALVTGTNGKSTSVRLLAAMAMAAGKTAGLCTTDWIRVGNQIVAHGDYSGPGGARLVLGDRRVELALLETARGGILRRGLAVQRAEAGLITNVAADHLGEWGMHDVEDLALGKFVLASIIKPKGRLVLNADDPVVVRHAAQVQVPILWFSLDARNATLRQSLLRGGDACFLEDAGLWRIWQGRRERVALVGEIPITLDGAARHNVANALGAIGVATVLGLQLMAIAEGLRRFQSTAEQNPGRLNVFDLGGARVLADFAHNPHGMAAVADMARRMPAQRRLVVLGQAGDRDDQSIQELVQVAWSLEPDRVVIKEMEVHLRGRPRGEVPRLIEQELLRLGCAPEALEHAESEFAAALSALRWCRPGDLVLLLLHAERSRVLELLARLAREGWQPGQDLPVT